MTVGEPGRSSSTAVISSAASASAFSTARRIAGAAAAASAPAISRVRSSPSAAAADSCSGYLCEVVIQLHDVIMTSFVPSLQWQRVMTARGPARGSLASPAPPVRLGTHVRSAPHDPVSGAAESREHGVPDIVPLKVQAIAWTHFEPPADVPWDTDADGGEALAEFAGRACYQSWKKPNPATATNAGYLRHILEVGHLSVLEHGSVTFYLSGISRSLTHELIRHRHFSYSQLSQRYVPEKDAAMVEPDVIADDPELHAKFVAATEAAVARLHRAARGPGEEVRRRRARDAAAQAGPPGRARGAAQRHRDPHRGHRQLPRLAALRGHARLRARRRRDPRAGDRLPARAASASPPTPSPTSRSPRCPTAPRSPPARSSAEG